MYLRHPKTIAELRAYSGQEEGAPPMRAKRGNLPDLYDDKPTGRSKSWKRHRQTRYRD